MPDESCRRLLEVFLAQDFLPTLASLAATLPRKTKHFLLTASPFRFIWILGS